MAGNKTVQAAKRAGIEEVIIVPVTGKQLIVAQRTDLDLATDVRAKGLAIADNRTGEVGLAWDAAVLEDFQADGVDLSPMWTEEELAKFTADGAAGGDGEPAEVTAKEQWAVLVFCANEAEQQKFIARMQKDGRDCRALMS
jgi:hypothetical protein